MERINRKYLIDEIEGLRQGFKDALDFGSKDKAFQMSMDALHLNADRLIVELGGESVRVENTCLN
jgi:hypothetical protein